jgi:hypothetical protein
MPAVGDLVTNLLGNYEPLRRVFDKARAGATSWESHTVAAVKNVQGKLGAVGKGAFQNIGGSAMGALFGGGATLGSLVAFDQMIAGAKEISRESREMGVSAVFYQQLSASALKAGHDIETVRTGFTHMQNLVADAATKGGETAQVFAKLGLRPEELLGKNAEQQFRAVAAAIMGIGNASLRTQAELDVFGRSGKQLETTLRQVADNSISAFSYLSEQTIYNLKQLSGQTPGVFRDIINAEAEGLGYVAEIAETFRLMVTKKLSFGDAIATAIEQQRQAIQAEKEGAEAIRDQAEWDKQALALEKERAALAKQTASQFEQMRDAAAKANEVGMSQGAQHAAAMMRQGVNSDVAKIIGQQEDLLSVRKKIHDLELEERTVGMTPAAAARARMEAEGLGGSAGKVEAIQERIDQAKAARDVTKKFASPEQSLREELANLDKLKGLAPPDTLERAKKDAEQHYLSATGTSEPTPVFSYAKTAGSKEAYEDLMGHLAEGQKDKTQEAMLKAAERTAAGVEAIAGNQQRGGTGGGDDIEQLAGNSRTGT